MCYVVSTGRWGEQISKKLSLFPLELSLEPSLVSREGSLRAFSPSLKCVTSRRPAHSIVS